MTTQESIIEEIFDNYFASGKKEPDGSPHYEILVKSISIEKRHINAEVYFKSGYTYCCGELTCHFKANWNRIRELARVSGLVLPENLNIEFQVTIEKGAKIKAHNSIDLPIESGAYQYVQVFSENTDA
jgi:hypothetical protein